jgi:glycosyltransferase involved in cell wall biosynthesis
MEFDIPKKYEKKILCVARISPQKKFDIFLDVARLLSRYAFIWIGNQHEMRGMPENVFCMGNVPNAGNYNQFVDLFMLPSNYEGLPVVIIEAMRFGKPIVASKVGGISEIVIDDVNGYTVENDAKVFAEKIKYILDNECVYIKFSENSKCIFNEKLTVDKMVNSYLNIYNSTIRKS